MTHRLTLVVLLALGACSVAPKRPNIVYILADDLGFGELGCYGQRKIRTPNIDRLAAQGMRFTRHYAGAPVCAPSRCVLMTGRHLGHATIRDNKPAPDRQEGQWPIRADDRTVGAVLQDAGYRTAMVGKWGLGPSGSSGDPNQHGFEIFSGFICQRVAHSYYPPHVWRNRERITINASPIRGHHRPAPGAEIDFDSYYGETYAPPVMLRDAIRFMEQNRDRPFFLYYAPLQPHVAMHPPKALLDRYPREWDAAPYRGTRGYLPHPRPRAGYAAMITDLDDEVGAIVAAIDRLGLAKNTLVIFSSDNGPTHDVGGVDTEFFDSSGGLRGRKGSVYEGGIRVPMIARWPGTVAAGSTSGHVSAFCDVMATLADAAGTRPPADTDGISFLPTLTGRGEQVGHGHLVWEFHGYGGQQALIFGDLKLVRRGLKPGHGPNPPELYDLSSDPGETRDLAAERPEVIAQALRVLARDRGSNAVFPLPALDGDG